MNSNQLQQIASHLNVTTEQIDWVRTQFTFKGSEVLLVRVHGKSPRFVSKKVIMQQEEMVTLRVAFCHTIDNDDYKFSTKKEASAIAANLTTNKVTVTDYEKTEDYAYILFNEYIEVQVTKADMKNHYVADLVRDVKPSIAGGEFRYAKSI